MNNHRPFLQAIIRNPTDDGPRLVYADWLEEHGECERAEFIRVQCELSSIRGVAPPICNRYADQMSCDCPRCERYYASRANERRLRQRSRELLNPHEVEWLPDWWPAFSTSAGGDIIPMWRRGFVARVQLTTELFLGRRCSKDCRLCHSVGYISGLAKPLFQNNPIEEVLLIDRAPYLYEWGFAAHWYDLDLTRGSPVHPASNVPSVIYQLLEGVKLERHKEYKSVQDASADLSRACVKYGRSLISWSNEEGISDEEASEPQVKAGSNAH